MADRQQENKERDKEKSGNAHKRSGGGQGEQYSKGTHSYQNDEDPNQGSSHVAHQTDQHGEQQSEKQRERIGSRDNNDHDAHDDESGKIIRQGSRTK